MLSLDALKFDGNLLARDDVSAKINVTKTATTDLTANPILVTDTEILEYDVSDVLRKWLHTDA
jgi:hypothetical protein